jgi:glycosyltransferase involved in cell wall biosynthesis
LNVLHINLAQGWRGGERQTLLLMEGLRARGVENALVAGEGAELAHRARSAGFSVHERGGLPALVALAGHDLLHAHEARAVGLAVLGKPLHRRPVVATRRVDNRPGAGWLSHFKYRHVDRLVAISEAVRRVLVEWDSALGPIPMIPSAVPMEIYPDPARVSALRERFRGHRVIGMVGALVTRHKDPLTLLEAFRRVAAVREDPVLVFVGDGPDRGALEAAVAASGLRHRVFVEGFQQDPWAYYAVMDVFALSSRTEGLGTAILDAFAADVPVVACRAGGIPELIGADERGWLARTQDPEDLARALLDALDHPREAARRAREAREYLRQRHSVETMAAAYHALYREVAAASD